MRTHLGSTKTARRHTEIFTTLAFWLRSSVVSVLNSLTTITEAPPPVSGYLIFAALVLGALLATSGRDDLATAVPACVVGGTSFFLFSLPSTIWSLQLKFSGVTVKVQLAF